MSQLLHDYPTEEQIQIVRKNAGTSEEKINEAVEKILEWISQQPHLPKALDKRRIENTYINNKCSIERSKQSIDAYFSLKNKFPEYFMNRDPLDKDIQDNLKYRKLFPMPKTTEKGERVLIMCDVGDAADFNIVADTKVVVMTAELGLLQDYRNGVIVIIDMKCINMSHLTIYPPNQIIKLELFLKTAYSNRIKAIHFINASLVMEALLNFIKPVLSPKLYERIHVHVKNSTTLLDFVPKNCLPNEMGGTGGTVDEIYESWKEVMVQHRDWFLEQDNYVSDESKRLGKFPLGDLHGLEGTFTKLNID